MNAKPLQWDIFCQVVDNYGDIGVCWRLARDLHARGQRVKLWLDDANHLQWLAPDWQSSGIAIAPWSDAAAFQAGDVLVEAFGCQLPADIIERAESRKPVWLNLEYLSAEDFVERNHGLPSPHTCADGSVWQKYFFYPGFTPRTGGLLREADLHSRQQAFDKSAWLLAQNIHWQGETLVSLFCYEPAALTSLLSLLADLDEPVHMLVCAGRSQAAFDKARAQISASQQSKLRYTHLPFLSQTEFDHLLWACDVNFVRGEDSLVRAIWAGKPFVWQIYEQDDGAHHAKLAAFLHRLRLPPAAQRWHQWWNGLQHEVFTSQDWKDLRVEQAIFAALAHKLAAEKSLSQSLLAFVEAKTSA